MKMYGKLRYLKFSAVNTTPALQNSFKQISFVKLPVRALWSGYKK